MKKVEEILGRKGKLISWSKTNYCKSNPNHLVIFNSNVCTLTEKLWWGDIDLTISKGNLVQLAKELNEAIFVLYEMDGRFENEDSPILDRFILKFLPSGEVVPNEYYSKFGFYAKYKI